MSPDPKLKEKIVLATLQVIEKDGLTAVTTRRIAKGAGVNIAAINYYFGSKDKLLQEALKFSLQSAFSDWETALKDPSHRIDDAVAFILLEFLVGGARFPGLSKAHFHQAWHHDHYKGLMMKRFNTLLPLLAEQWQKARPDLKPETLQWSVIQLLSAVLLPALLPRLFQAFNGVDFRHDKTQKSYLTHLLQTFGFTAELGTLNPLTPRPSSGPFAEVSE